MALTGGGSQVQLPDSDNHMRDFEDAVKSNRPNMALYHLVTIVKDLEVRLAKVETPKSGPKKTTKAKAVAGSEED